MLQKVHSPLAQSKIIHYLCTANQKFADILKAFISACFGSLKSGKFQPIQNKKAVNALWDMTIPPAEHPLLDCSVWWHSYSAWAFIAYSYWKGLPEPQGRE